MNKCLVTRFRGIDDDDNLIVLGRLILRATSLSTLSSSSQVMLTLQTDKSITISVTGNGYFAYSFSGLDDPESRMTTLTLTQASGKKLLYFKNDNYNIYISNKYDITYIENGAGSSSMPGNISAKLEDLSYIEKPTTVRFAFCNSTGSINSLVRLTSVTEMVFPGTSVTGSVDVFVAGQVANGRVTESTGIYSYNLLRFATFAGRIVDVGGQQLLTWESAAKISVYNASSIASATTVYTKGYTQSQAEAAFPGKTIVRVDA